MSLPPDLDATGRTPGPRRTRDGAGKLRLFFALWPDAAARAALAQLANEIAAKTGGRAPAIENLHLTLAFVGEVAGESVAALHGVGRVAAAGVAPFALILDRVGVFRSAGIAWAGASAPPPELVQLVAHLNAALASEDFPTERRTFQPHLTLARRCRIRVSGAIPAPIAWPVERITLNASETLPNGPRYRAVAQWRLGGPAAATGTPV